MRGHPQVASQRLLPSITRRGWTAWMTELKRRRRDLKEEQLEVIERIGAEERRARRSGEHIPDLDSARRWC